MPTRRLSLTLLGGLIALSGCSRAADEAAPQAVGPAPGAASASTASAEPAKPASAEPAKPASAESAKPAAPAPPEVKVAQAPPAAAPNPGKPVVEFKGPVAWRDWETGMAEAKTSGKPVFLMVYADWCPKCRAWSSEFEAADFVEASKDFVMIRQNQEERPEWLGTYSSFGGYVPRMFFLDAAGAVREELNSGHPRYPYFYASQQKDRLVAVMAKAAETPAP